MQYITTDDLTTDSYERFINESKGDPATGTVEKCEQRAISMVVTYLTGLYDTDAIFGQTIPGDEEDEEPTVIPPIRNELLVDIICKITLYKLFRRNAARKVPEDTKEDYTWAIGELGKINSGRTKLKDLPPAQDESGGIVSDAIFGNNKNSDYYL